MHFSKNYSQNLSKSSCVASCAYLQSSFLLSAYISLIRPIDNSSKSVIGLTVRTLTGIRELSFHGLSDEVFLASTSVCTFNPQSSMSRGSTIPLELHTVNSRNGSRCLKRHLLTINLKLCSITQRHHLPYTKKRTANTSSC